MAKNGTNGSKTITLPDSGKEVVFDLNKIRESVKTRKDFKQLLRMDKGDQYDRWIAEHTNLSYEEIEGLSMPDFLALDKATGPTIGEVFAPN